MPETTNTVPGSTAPLPPMQPKFEPAKKNNMGLIALVIVVVLLVLLAVFMLFTDPGKNFLRSVGVIPAEVTTSSSYSTTSSEEGVDYTGLAGEDAIGEAGNEITDTVTTLEAELDSTLEDFDEELEFGL